jgi:hypothetical protein
MTKLLKKHHKELKKLTPVVLTKAKPKDDKNDKKSEKEQKDKIEDKSKEESSLEKDSSFHENIFEESIPLEAPVIKSDDEKVDNLEQFAEDLPRPSSLAENTRQTSPYASTNINYGLNSSSGLNYDGSTNYQQGQGDANLSPFDDRRNEVISPFSNQPQNRDDFQSREDRRQREERETNLPFNQKRKRLDVF